MWRSGLSSGAMVRRLAVVLLVPAMLVAGCSGDDDVASSTTFAPPETNPPLPTSSTMGEVSGEDATTAPESADTTAPTTSAAVTTSTSSSMVTVTTNPDDTTPTTDPDEFDWVAIVQGLYDTLDDINADPDVLRIDEFCVPVESPCRSAQGAQVEALVRDGWRVVDAVPIPVTSVALKTTVDGRPPAESTLVVLDVTIGPSDGSVGQIVDANGNVLFDIEADEDGGTETWFVRRGTSGNWRVYEIG